MFELIYSPEPRNPVDEVFRSPKRRQMLPHNPGDAVHGCRYVP